MRSVTDDTLLISYLCPIDGLGAFSRAYFSMVAHYITLANMPRKFRQRLSNLRLVTLLPPGSDFYECMKIIYQDAASLTRGKTFILCSSAGTVRRFVRCTPIGFTTDLPEGHRQVGVIGNHCRGCVVPKTVEMLRVPPIAPHRQMSETLRIRQEIENAPSDAERCDNLGF
jgi:hypothetical protein